MIKLLLALILFMSVRSFGAASPAATELFKMTFSWAIAADPYLVGFKSSLHGEKIKIFERYKDEVRQMVIKSYCEPMISQSSDLITEKMTPTEIAALVKFYKSPTGKKYLLVAGQSPHPKFSEVMTKTEMQELENFFSTPVSKKWDNTAKQLHPIQNKLTQALQTNLIDFFKSKSGS